MATVKWLFDKTACDFYSGAVCATAFIKGGAYWWLLLILVPLSILGSVLGYRSRDGRRLQ